MAYRGKPDFLDLPLPGDDPRYPPIADDDPSKPLANELRELMLEGGMHPEATGAWVPNQPMPRGAENYAPLGGPWPAHPEVARVVPGVRDVVEQFREKGITVCWQWGGFLADGVTVTPASPAFVGSYLLNRTPEPSDNRSRSWEVQLWAYEAQQVVPFGGGPVTAQKLPNDPNTYGSRLRARIAWNGASGGTFRDVDIAEGFRATIRAAQVTVYLVYPQPANLQIIEGPTIPNLGLGGGLVLTSQVGAMLTESEETSPGPSCTLTETFIVPAGTANFPIRVAPGAQRVSGYQTGAGVPFTLEWQLLRGIAGSPSLGELVLGPARRIDHIARLGNAGQLVTGAADGVDRVLTLIWELDI